MSCTGRHHTLSSVQLVRFYLVIYMYEYLFCHVKYQVKYSITVLGPKTICAFPYITICPVTISMSKYVDFINHCKLFEVDKLKLKPDLQCKISGWQFSFFWLFVVSRHVQPPPSMFSMLFSCRLIKPVFLV